MVPRQNEHIQGLGRNQGTQFSMNCFHLFKRDYDVIDMLTNRLERVGQGGTGEFFHHGEKQHQFRAYALYGTQSPFQRADLQRFTK